jgi:NADPH-dependent glutamate synthase beta subunit-like oxidoreductase/NAD(P)H-flavin reductase
LSEQPITHPGGLPGGARAHHPRDVALGIPGFRYADLFSPPRLAALAAAFDDWLAREAPDAAARFAAWRAAPDALDNVAAAERILETAPHLSRFVARLFHIEAEHERHLAAAHAFDPIWRFKKEYVQRRLKKYKPTDLVGRTEHELGEQVAALRDAAFAAELAAPGVPAAAEAAASDDERAVAVVAIGLLDLAEAFARAPKAAAGDAAAREAVEGAARRATAIRDALRAHPAAAARLGDALDAAGPADSGADGDPTAADVPGLGRFVGALLAVVDAWVYMRREAAAAQPRHHRWVSFVVPETLHFDHLVETKRLDPASAPELFTGVDSTRRARDGFELTDARMSLKQALGEIDYCLYCHAREKDSCRFGLMDKKEPAKRRLNPLGVPLTGCPLDERISEMHLLKKEGDSIAALATIMIDNPMVPGTGHRICNDCMKACVFQNQDPVNIPQAETRVVTDVLFDLPWGFEIYGLLTRWNPLNVKRPVQLPYNGKNVLVVGAGPAGYTLAQFLVNEGFGVVIVDGLKIEPLPDELVGADVDGPDGEPLPRPVRDWRELYRSLDERILTGFGGVSEYGITVRWDKNFLDLLYVTLARQRKLRIYGGVRFGGTLTLDDAWALGFDHVALATGAGRPTTVAVRNNLSRGMRAASDFLMALQLTGAYKRSALANLEMRLPALVIGGGLTAIDTATELVAYYPRQVEKTLARWEELCAAFGEERARALYRGAPDQEAVLEEFLAHGREVRAERARAKAEGRAPDLAGLVARWGGVTLVYRKSLQDSPAYRLNHEEVIKALEEGILYREKLSPTEAVLDELGAVKAMAFERHAPDAKGKWRATGETLTLPARAILVAAGTHPNAIYEKERPGTFRKDRWGEFYLGYRAVRDEGANGSGGGNGNGNGAGGGGHWKVVPVEGEPEWGSAAPVGFFTSYEKDGRFVSYYGDNHPVYEGNVVKAMASAKDGYPHVVALFADELARLDPTRQPERETAWHALRARLDDGLVARVVEVVRLTPTIVEVVCRAPFAARQFEPGQFYRLQNFERTAPVVNGTRLATEGMALTGAWTDRARGLISVIVLEMGVSSRLCAAFRPGERVVLMGPTGAPTEIPHEAGTKKESVLLCGGGLGNAVLFSIAAAFKQAGHRVLYFAAYKRRLDLYKQDFIEAATDQVVWSVDSGDVVAPRRPQDVSFRGNIVQAMLAYAKGELGTPLVPFLEVDRVIAIGSDRMMNAVREARFGVLREHLCRGHKAIASINSTMQCMMKEICAQCLQKHVDPETGKEAGYVFSCFNQDQPMDAVDFKNLNDRLRHNAVQEKLSNLYLDLLLQQQPDLLRI